MPPVVSRPIWSLKPPPSVGWKVTFTVIDWPGASWSLGAGMPLVPKGASGMSTALIVRAVPPTLEKVTVLES